MSESINNSEPQTIEQLTERFKRLDKEREEAKTALTQAETRLNMAKEKAREQYGTDDLVELRAKLAEWQKQNVEARAAYEAELNAIEDELSKVQREHESVDRTEAASI
jgi:hypothetical protein